MTAEGPSGRFRRRALVFLVKVVVGVAIILFLVSRIDLTHGWRTILHGDPILCLAAFVLFGLSRLAEGIRLYYLVPGRETALGRAIEVVFISTFFNNFTAFVVGDGYRVAKLWKGLGSLQTAVTVVVIDRLLGIAAIVGLGLLYVPLFSGRLQSIAEDVSFSLPGPTAAALLFAGCAATVAVIVFLLGKNQDIVENKAREIKLLISRIQLRNWLAASFWSITAQLAVAGMIFSLVIGYDCTLFYADVVFIMLFVFVASYIPVSVGSLGIREGAVVLGLVAFGIPKSVALAVALVSRIMIYQYALIAGFVLVFRRPQIDNKPDETSTLSI